MSHRPGYKQNVVSVTQLLTWYARNGHPKLWPVYPPDPSGYYRKRGHFVDQCCAILAQRKELDKVTMELAGTLRIKPLSTNEYWWDYIYPFRDWFLQHDVEYIHSQVYMHNVTEGYQGTDDLFCLVDRRPTMIDFKTGDAPEGTRYQIALYDMAHKPRYIDDHKNIYNRYDRLCLRLRPGECKPIPYPDDRDYATALMMARLYNSPLKELR